MYFIPPILWLAIIATVVLRKSKRNEGINKNRWLIILASFVLTSALVFSLSDQIAKIDGKLEGIVDVLWLVFLLFLAPLMFVSLICKMFANKER